jgi:hypothetical protein
MPSINAVTQKTQLSCFTVHMVVRQMKSLENPMTVV